MWLISLAWFVASGCAMMVLINYAQTPGIPMRPVASWPADTSLPRPQNHPALVMFVHPKCPCSRATIGELAMVMRHCAGLMSANVFFIRPSPVSPGWEKTDLWKSASEIPGVTVHSDPDGVEARRFGAATSGAAMLYDTAGELVFSGGITAARGHSGDNTGRQAIIALIHNESPLVHETPVFGCGLFDPGANCPQKEEDGKTCCRP
jgi:hypothetical protein